MKLYIVRHGATELNQKHLVNGWLDEPLVEEGIKQAEELRDNLPADIKRIYCSPLLRAKQTAEIINQRFQVAITYHDELKELNWGTLTGKSFADMEKEYGPEYGKDKYARLEYDYRPLGGESVEGMRKRVHKIVDHIKASHKKGPVLVVTHGGVLRILEHDYNQKLISDMKNGHIVEIEV